MVLIISLRPIWGVLKEKRQLFKSSLSEDAFNELYISNILSSFELFEIPLANNYIFLNDVANDSIIHHLYRSGVTQLKPSTGALDYLICRRDTLTLGYWE